MLRDAASLLDEAELTVLAVGPGLGQPAGIGAGARAGAATALRAGRRRTESAGRRHQPGRAGAPAPAPCVLTRTLAKPHGY